MSEIKTVGKNVAVAFGFIVALVSGAAGIAVGGLAGYTKGYKQGESAARLQLSSMGCVITGPDGKPITAESFNAGLTIPKGSALTGECFNQN